MVCGCPGAGKVRVAPGGTRVAEAERCYVLYPSMNSVSGVYVAGRRTENIDVDLVSELAR